MLVDNTIRMSVEFYDWDNSTLIDPDEVILTIYDMQFRVLETYNSDSIVKDSTGTYHLFYVPSETGKFIKEWKGTFGSLPSITREQFLITQI